MIWKDILKMMLKNIVMILIFSNGGEARLKYHVLSRMARDILAILVSTVSSESAFNTGGRVLDSYRSSLHPSTVVALICTQNWLRSKPEKVANLQSHINEDDSELPEINALQ